MNRQQKRMVANLAVVIVITIGASAGMVELKNWVNRSESMRAMEQLGRLVDDYRQKNGSVPPESYIDSIKESLEGRVRLGNLRYRARWIEFNSPPETVLAYVVKDYHSLFFHPEAIVLWLDGRVQWVDKKQFDTVLASQQSRMESEMTPK